MSRKAMAEFTVRIFSTEHASWQGEVESGGEGFHFESEIELLDWLWKKWPELVPRSADGAISLRETGSTGSNGQEIERGGKEE